MTQQETTSIDVGADFTRFPAGRYRTDGKFSGERFREDFLIPHLKRGVVTTIYLDNTMGYGSSFLEEAFGGLIRAGFESQFVLDHLNLVSVDGSLIEEIVEYIQLGQ